MALSPPGIPGQRKYSVTLKKKLSDNPCSCFSPPNVLPRSDISLTESPEAKESTTSKQGGLRKMANVFKFLSLFRLSGTRMPGLSVLQQSPAISRNENGQRKRCGMQRSATEPLW